MNLTYPSLDVRYVQGMDDLLTNFDESFGFFTVLYDPNNCSQPLCGPNSSEVPNGCESFAQVRFLKEDLEMGIFILVLAFRWIQAGLGLFSIVG